MSLLNKKLVAGAIEGVISKTESSESNVWESFERLIKLMVVPAEMVTFMGENESVSIRMYWGGNSPPLGV